MGFVDEDSMCRALSRQLHLQTIELDSAALPPNVAQLMRVDLCERYGVFPVAGDPKTRTLTLATSDPTNTEAISELQIATNSRIVCVVSTASAIDRATRRYYYGEGPAPRPAPAAPGPNGAPAPAGPTVPSPPPPTASLDLDELLGVAPARPRPAGAPGAAPSSIDDGKLRREVAVLKEQLDNLEKVTASQVRALRGLVELLIQSGLISRDEYLVKVHKPD
jgi:type IV pilus assembly protein PilB